MEKSLNNNFGHISLYLLWAGLYLIFGVIIPILSAEVRLILRTYAITGLVCGTFLISLSNMVFFKGWIQISWYINDLITLITGGIIAYYIVKMITL
ncbi:hypothetical protein TH53_18815 [Pedobacter lusitanus]|uniref:Uncharacterized protein n=1 Tax=Pedobacter lusitanus TaxID=1503925 RepID=A0A0D0FTJ2_9SPHI|nr:hypothetical protein [Pedobacter lusitanus]KIO75769.1 hypothetical protein TH53_18815 [Pedobacter lusitanus]